MCLIIEECPFYVPPATPSEVRFPAPNRSSPYCYVARPRRMRHVHGACDIIVFGAWTDRRDNASARLSPCWSRRSLEALEKHKQEPLHLEVTKKERKLSKCSLCKKQFTSPAQLQVMSHIPIRT